MNISQATSVSNTARMRTDNAAGGAANVNTRDSASQRAERTGQAQPAAQTRTQPQGDTYEPGTGAAANAASTGQADRARETVNRAAERNVSDTNAAAARPRNEAAGTTIDLVG